MEKKKPKKPKTTYDKCAVENKIRLFSFKHRGDLTAILKEAKTEFPDKADEIDMALVKRVYNKLKREEKDNDPFLATWAFEYILEGTRQRQVEWDEENRIYQEALYLHKSFCCNEIAVEMRLNADTEEIGMRCTKCMEPCQTRKELNLKVMEDRRANRIEKRNDEKAIASTLNELGFGKKSVPAVRTTNYQAVLPAPPGTAAPAALPPASPRKQVHSEEVLDATREVVTNINSLDPMDREEVVGRLRQRIDDLTHDASPVENVEKDDDGKS